MIIVGCTSVTDGDATVAEGEAPLYRASVTASIEESEASSSARESERQASMSVEAVRTSCEAMSSSSAEAIGAVNTYVDAFNSNPAEIARTAGPAVDALNHSADLVAGSISDPLAPELARRAEQLGRRGARRLRRPSPASIRPTNSTPRSPC